MVYFPLGRRVGIRPLASTSIGTFIHTIVQKALTLETGPLGNSHVRSNFDDPKILAWNQPLVVQGVPDQSPQVRGYLRATYAKVPTSKKALNGLFGI